MQQIFENETVYKLPLNEFYNSSDLAKSPLVSGNVEASVLIIFKSEHDLLEEKKHQFLSKMLQAVKVDIQDVLLVNKELELNLVALNKLINPKTIFLFDVHPSEVGVQKHVELYEIYTFKDCKFIFGEDLDLIESNVNSKKAIWAVLKKIFEV